MGIRIKIKIKYYHLLIAFIILLIAVLLPYYKNNTIILGGEGNFFINFKVLIGNNNFTWLNRGTGFPSTSLNYNFFIVYFLALLERVFNERIVNFVVVFLIYFLPFFGMYLICIELKIKPGISFLISYFYIINPFSLYFLTAINQWNTIALFILPFFFFIILKFYYNNIGLFLFFGVTSLIFAYGNANTPLMVIYQIAIIVYLIFVSIYYEISFSWKHFVKKYIIVLSSFILFNLWWIFNWVSVFTDVFKMYSEGFAIGWEAGVVNRPKLLWEAITLTNLIPKHSDIFNYLYNFAISSFIVIVPFFIVFYILYKQGLKNAKILFLFSGALIIIFLTKGSSPPFGVIYTLMLKYVPFFSVFKTPIEKWGVLYVFIFTLMMGFGLKNIKNNKVNKYIFGVFILVLVYYSIPFLSSKFIPDYQMVDGNWGTRRYLDKVEYKELRQKINNDLRDYRVLSLPGSLNYQVALSTSKGKYYTGLDPLLHGINKQFIAQYFFSYLADYNVLYDNISMQNYLDLLSMYNIGKIVINKDMHPWFGFKEKESIEKIELIFDKIMDGEKNNVISMYENREFIPHIYTSNNIYFVSGPPGVYKKLIEIGDIGSKPVLLTNPQINLNLLLQSSKNLYTEPEIIFKKINPAKYLIKITNAEYPFWLVFLESFHAKWKLFDNKYINNNTNEFKEMLVEYPQFKVAEAKHVNKFVMKDIIFLFVKPLEVLHTNVNVYANGWFIEPEKIGHNNEMILTLYFLPQSLFYLGVIISGITFLIAILLLVRNYIKPENRK